MENRNGKIMEHEMRSGAMDGLVQGRVEGSGG